MKQVWKRLVSAALAAMLLLCVPSAVAEGAYGICTGDNVAVRILPDIEAEAWFNIDEGYVCAVEKVEEVGEDVWFKVNSAHPEGDGNSYIGYVHSDHFRLLSPSELADMGLAEEEAPTLRPSADAALDADAADYTAITGPSVTGGSGTVSTDNVNFRSAPSTESQKIVALKKGTAVELLSMPPARTSAYWYRVRYQGDVGYIRADYIRVKEAGATYTPAPTPTATPTPTPYKPDYSDIIGPEVEDATGRVTADEVNLRNEPSTNGAKLGVMMKGDVVELLTIPPKKGDAYWYRVRVNGIVGYIQSNYIAVLTVSLTPTPTQAAQPTPVVTLDPDGADLVGALGMITAGGVNFRQSPSMDGQKLGSLDTGAVVELLSIPDTISENHWYRVRYNGQVGYIQSLFIRVLSEGEKPTTPEALYGYAMLDCESGNLRDRPGGKTVTQWRGYGTLLMIAGPREQTAAKDYWWYPVYYGAKNDIYYIREDIIKVVNASGSEVTPTPSKPAVSPYGYVITTAGGVNLRLQPAGEIIVEVRMNTVLPCIGEPVTPEGSQYVWYYVEYNGLRGYMRGDNVRVCNADGGSILDPTPTVIPTVTPEPGSLGYVKLVKNMVAIRVTAGGTSLGTLPENLILPIVGATKTVGKYDWYHVRTADGIVGYIREDMLMLCDENGNKPAATASPTPTAPVTSTYGYVQLTSGGVNLRVTPGGSVLLTLNKGSVWPMCGIPVYQEQHLWYPIVAEGQTGFVRDDMLYQLSQSQVDSYLAGLGIPKETPAPETVDSEFLKVTGSSVNLREAAGVDNITRYQVKKGTVIPFIGEKKVGTQKWYNVVYEGLELWIHGGYAKVMSMAEYNAWLADNGVEAPKQLGYVRFTTNGVNVRNAANGSKIIDRLNRGTVVPYFKEGISAGGDLWYYIQTPSGQMGYSSADYLEKCDKDGNDLPLVTPPPGSSSGGNSQQEASYTTLKLGSTGLAVKNLVTELKNQGYYSGAITEKYTSEVRTAVMAFQADKGLTVDGVAGSNTQHKLFGTVPVGSGNHNDLSFDFYPVEKIDWYTGGIQQMWPRGANYKLYDIKSGMVWWAHRWAGSRHADIEPLTAADTAKLCQMYGVDDAQDIYDNNLWHRRPTLVTIGTRTFACSLDGMPHNPDGDTIPDNNMTGQICLHFTNSEGHESQQVSSSHKKAIEEAYAWAKEHYGAK